MTRTTPKIAAFLGFISVHKKYFGYFLFMERKPGHNLMTEQFDRIKYNT